MEPFRMTRKILILLFWALLWQAASMMVGNSILLTGPADVLKTLASLAVTADFWKTIACSSGKIILGFFLAFAAGLLAGTAAFRLTLLKELLAPVISLMKSIPVASFVILALIWIGSENLCIFISFLVVLPMIYVNTLAGLESTDPKLLEMADVFGVPFLRRIRFLYLPVLLPYLVSGCRVALGMSMQRISGDLAGMVQIFAPAISSWHSPIGNVLSPFLIFYGDPVMLEFLFAVLAYYLLRYLYRRHTLHPVSRTVSLVSAVCIPVIFCLLAYFTPRINVIGFLRLPQWGLPALLLLILAFLAGLRLSMPRFFVQLGNISYSLYLVHYYPVMFLDRVVFDFSTLSVLSVVGLIVSVVISIVLAYLCWILIERKFTGWLRRILLR